MFSFIIAKNFIRALLVPDPLKRLTATQALAHPWLEGTTASNHNLMDNVRGIFDAKKRLRSAVEAVQALNTMRRIATANTVVATTVVAKNAAA